MNLPNKLTVARIILTPVFMLLFALNFSGHYLVALVVFAVASFTDMLDGKIARKHNLVTNFGKFLDPLADKMLTTSAFLGFLYNRIGYGILAIVFIVLFREFLVSSLRLVVVSSGEAKVIAANIWGKLKTVTQMAAIIFTMAVCQVAEWWPEMTTLNRALDVSASVLLWVSTVLCVISGAIYLKQNSEFINSSK